MNEMILIGILVVLLVINRFIGKTNAEAAEKGLAPQLNNGSFATLHLLGQDSRSLWLKQVQDIIGLVNIVKIYCTVNIIEVNLILNFQLIVPNLV